MDRLVDALTVKPDSTNPKNGGGFVSNYPSGVVNEDLHYFFTDKAGKRYDLDRNFITDKILEQGVTPELIIGNKWGSACNVFELSQQNFTPTIEYVENLIPNGVTLMVGPSKANKTWFGLQSGLCIACGVPFLGYNVKQSGVLYITLDTFVRQVADRLGKMWDSKPSNFYVLGKGQRDFYGNPVQFSALGDGFEEELTGFLNMYTDVKVVYIDVLANVLPMERKTSNVYLNDYTLIANLAEYIEIHHSDVAVVIMHHFNKADGDGDITRRISGSTGLLGAANNAILIDFVNNDRNSSERTVTVISRVIDTEDIRIKFDKERFNFVYAGDAYDAEKRRFEARNVVKELLQILGDHQSAVFKTKEVLEGAKAHFGNADEFQTPESFGKWLNGDDTKERFRSIGIGMNFPKGKNDKQIYRL